MSPQLRTLSTSESSCYHACPRRHFYRYELRRRPHSRAHALRFGSLVHRGLEAWWLDSTATALDACLNAIRRPNTEDAEPSDPFDVARATALMVGYHERWTAGDDELGELDVLAVEEPFRVPLINPATGSPSRTFEFAGVIDAIVRSRADGLVYIVEHKTSSEDVSPGSDYWIRLRLDQQVSAYYAGARALGYDVAGCLYDVVGKPGIRPLLATPMEARKYTKAKPARPARPATAKRAATPAKPAEPSRLYAGQREHDESAHEHLVRVAEHIAERPDRYYQRAIVVRLEQDERDAAADLWQTARAIRDGARLGQHPRHTAACILPGRRCEYLDVCSGMASINDPQRFSGGNSNENQENAA